MTKKDYAMLANQMAAAIRATAKAKGGVEMLARHMIMAVSVGIKRDNPAFNSEIFEQYIMDKIGGEA